MAELELKLLEGNCSDNGVNGGLSSNYSTTVTSSNFVVSQNSSRRNTGNY